jgi:hypothetical protein
MVVGFSLCMLPTMYMAGADALSSTHILLLASSSGSTYDVNDDLSALLSFKYYIRNDPRQAPSPWDATKNGTNKLSTDFCRWNGIACNDRRHPGRVTAIHLRGSGLDGTISPHTLPETQLLGGAR